MPKGQKLQPDALLARRREARRLLDAGLSQADVARRLRISRQSVSRWSRQSLTALETVRRQGPKAHLDVKARAELRDLLAAGPQAAGFGGSVWTRAMVQQLITQRFGREYSSVHVWRLLGEIGFSLRPPRESRRNPPDRATHHDVYRGR